jgi:ferrochelatase
MTNSNVGILLTNIGTPSTPTPKAVRQYLKKFLSDSRVVELPRIIWWPILYGIILPFRSRRSAHLYQEIWTAQGSPLLINSLNIAKKLQTELQLPVELGMQYSDPSIQAALNKFKKNNINKIIVLPLYPQYSATTTASTFDIIAAIFKRWRNIPSLTTINDYATNPHYITAVANSIRMTWETQGKKHLLFSFHGIPQKYVDQGDPYAERCRETTRLITEELKLTPAEWTQTFQSRLGRAKWLTPYTDETLQAFPGQGITELQVICPGFAADCLETLEEIAMSGKEQFLATGGKSFYYIPALNDAAEHITALAKILFPK